MTFPTKQDRLFFSSEEAKRIQELWEQITIGDWYVDERGTVQVVEYERMICLAIGGSEVSIWLPRQDQLQEMLEERGYGLYHLGDERLQPDFEGRDWNPEEPYIAFAVREPSDHVEGTGPTPAIALGRALTGVLCVQHPEDTSASEGKEE